MPCWHLLRCWHSSGLSDNHLFFTEAPSDPRAFFFYMMARTLFRIGSMPFVLPPFLCFFFFYCLPPTPAHPRAPCKEGVVALGGGCPLIVGRTEDPPTVKGGGRTNHRGGGTWDPPKVQIFFLTLCGEFFFYAIVIFGGGSALPGQCSGVTPTPPSPS